MAQLNASQRLMDLIFHAVEEALTTLRDGQDFAPYVMLLTKEGYVLSRFAGTSLQERIDRAYHTLAAQDEDTLAYALVYDAVITVDNRDFDAIMVEAGERGQKKGLRLVQRYQPQTESSALESIGDLAYLGNAPQYFEK